MYQSVECRLAVGSDDIAYTLVVDTDLQDPIGQQVITGEWKLGPALMWLLESVRPGDTVLDLGAHFGTFAIPAAKLGARVVAVEGSPRNAEVLRVACEQNQLSNVEIIEAVVDRRVGEVAFVDLGPYGTIATPDICAATGYPTIQRITTTVDALPGASFQWAKIDIEGTELAVLGGASARLRELRGMAIESNGYALHSHGTSPRQLVEFLEDAGFGVYEVHDGALRRLRHPLTQPETILDYVAVRPGRQLLPGWKTLPPRKPADLIGSLMAESVHPIAEHREHAQRMINTLSGGLRRRYRRATRN
ncbi:MAG TPA: FkbM family methyltransferase [Acidimicrobiales bacterium]|nr:FkbM family methyltransferase [Acidimicrobiales bacterium]